MFWFWVPEMDFEDLNESSMLERWFRKFYVKILGSETEKRGKPLQGEFESRLLLRAARHQVNHKPWITVRNLSWIQLPETDTAGQQGDLPTNIYGQLQRVTSSLRTSYLPFVWESVLLTQLEKAPAAVYSYQERWVPRMWGWGSAASTPSLYQADLRVLGRSLKLPLSYWLYFHIMNTWFLVSAGPIKTCHNLLTCCLSLISLKFRISVRQSEFTFCLYQFVNLGRH